MKKFISLFLVFSLVMLSANLYAKERRGAKLIITKKDGQQIKGELFGVNKDSLLLFQAKISDVYVVGIKNIKVIRVVKKSKLLTGAWIGIAVGGGTGVLLGGSAAENMSLDPSGGRGVLGMFGAVVGLLVGGTVGAVKGIDKTIQIESMTDSEIKEALDKLRKKARIRDYK